MNLSSKMDPALSDCQWLTPSKMSAPKQAYWEKKRKARMRKLAREKDRMREAQEWEAKVYIRSNCYGSQIGRSTSV